MQFTPPASLDGAAPADQRRAALDRALAAPSPSSSQEFWRYSRIDALRLADYRPVGASGAATPAFTPEPLVFSPGAPEPVARVLTRNGAIVSIEVAPGVVGLRVSGAADAAEDAAEALLGAPRADGGCPMLDLTVALATDVVCVEAEAGAVVPGPVVVDHVVDVPGALCGVRLSVRAGRSAELAVVERWSTPEELDAVVLSAARVEAGDGAHVRFVSVQQAGPKTVLIAHQDLTTARDASLRAMSVALGGSYARVRTDAAMTGPGGANELLAVYFGDGDQMHDFRTLQHHLAPRTTSDLVFKGAVQGRSASVYSGLIRIAKEARHTVANQTNRNLLLSSEAQAESVPNLEIENNDVRCSHASAVGPIDDDQRYYLESRGVPPDVAQRLIVQGFFADLLAKVPVEGLAPALIAATTARFHAEEPS